MNKKEYFGEQITDTMKREIKKMEGIITELRGVIESPEAGIETKIMRYQEAIQKLQRDMTAILGMYFDIYK